MNINEFVSNFREGSRPNRFRITVVYPSFAGGDGRDLRFFARSSALPGSTLGVIEVPYMGRSFKVPGDRTFEDLTVTIMNTEDFRQRDALERWQNAINQFEANTRTQNNIFSRVILEQLSNSNTVLKTYTLQNCWPSAIGQMELSFDTNNQYHTFDVTWSYTHFTTNTTT
jgi:hypothetical protein